MKRATNFRTLLMTALAAIIIIGISNAQTTPRVMVVDFDTGIDVTQREAATMTSILTAHLQEEFEVVTTAEVFRIVNEKGFDPERMTVQQMELVDSLMNLSIIITGSINRRSGGYSILASALDAQTSTIETTVGETGERLDPFHRVATRVAQNLMAEIFRSEEPVPQEVDLEPLLRWDANNRGVIINGVRWATRNLDIQTGTFVESPEMAGRFNQWGDRGHWQMSPPVSRFAGFSEPSGPRLWGRGDDPCPQGWRVPYMDEFESLIAAGSFWTTVNGVPGRVFGTSPNQIFLPAAGGGGADPDMEHIRTHVAFEGQLGLYWTREQSLPGSFAFRLRFSQVDAVVGLDGHLTNVGFGYSIRCVVDTNEIMIEF